MLAMASARCSPTVRAFSSIGAPPAASAGAVRAGVGVDGAAAAEVLDWAGAAGGAGVEVDGAAGVAGVADVDALGAAAGFAWAFCFGQHRACRALVSENRLGWHRTLFTTQTTKPFSSIL
jgi:hypothetical protein